MGAPLNFNETRRIANYKIREESKQIPKDSTGMVYLPVNALYFLDFDMAEAVIDWQRKMKDYPNLFGIIVYGYLSYDAAATTMLSDGHFYSVKAMNEVVKRHLCFIRNGFYTGSASQDLLAGIYSSFD